MPNPEASNPNLAFTKLPVLNECRSFTTDTSFVLKAGKYGVGVFSVHGIKKDTRLNLFSNGSRLVTREEAEKNPVLKELCEFYAVISSEGYYAPKDFSSIDIGWYMNHSKRPNAYHDDGYRYYAKRDIKAGEEIFIDYSCL